MCRNLNHWLDFVFTHTFLFIDFLYNNNNVLIAINSKVQESTKQKSSIYRVYLPWKITTQNPGFYLHEHRLLGHSLLWDFRIFFFHSRELKIKVWVNNEKYTISIKEKKMFRVDINKRLMTKVFYK